MKVLFKSKDGGPLSTVTGYWLIENKKYFSIVLLKFEGASREAYHTHAFNSISWLLNGQLKELFLDNYRLINHYCPSLKPIFTSKNDFHMVNSVGTSWILSFRGPWETKWKEYTDKDKEYYLNDGRIKEI